MNGPIVKDDKIKTGDVVVLKSGGPPMTAGGVGPREESEHLEALPEGACVCSWFPESPIGRGAYVTTSPASPTYGSPERGVFHVDMLRRVPDPAEELRAAADAVYAALNDEGGPRGAGLRTRLGIALGKVTP